jgi:hypothetical protein
LNYDNTSLNYDNTYAAEEERTQQGNAAAEAQAEHILLHGLYTGRSQPQPRKPLDHGVSTDGQRLPTQICNSGKQQRIGSFEIKQQRIGSLVSIKQEAIGLIPIKQEAALPYARQLSDEKPVDHSCATSRGYFQPIPGQEDRRLS